MKRTPLRRKSPLRASKGLARTGPPARKVRVRRKNEARAARAWEQVYHSEDYVLAVQKMECAIPGCDRREIDAAHGEHSKGAGGDWRTILPLCGGLGGHHREQHNLGRRTFERKYGISLTAAAAATRKALAHITGEG